MLQVEAGLHFYHLAEQTFSRQTADWAGAVGVYDIMNMFMNGVRQFINTQGLCSPGKQRKQP